MERLEYASTATASSWEHRWAPVGDAAEPRMHADADASHAAHGELPNLATAHPAKPSPASQDNCALGLLESLLNTLPDAVMAVDVSRTLHWANRSARDWLARAEGGVRLVGNRLRGTTEQVERALHACVAAPLAVQRTLLPAPQHGMGPITVTTRRLCAEGTSYAALVATDAQRPLLAHGIPSLLLTLTLVAPHGNAQRSVLRAAFGLSSAEAHLASAMVTGRSLADCAQERNVAICTIRTQLASLYAKTGTRRQSELVALLARVQ
jgi:DNA-binding CsgD family transcriptional regulator